MSSGVAHPPQDRHVGGLFTNMLLRETGLTIEPQRIERLRQLHAEAYTRRTGQIRPLRCTDCLAYLTDAGLPWAIATSGRMETAGPGWRTLASI